jgi:hypothetical protein
MAVEIDDTKKGFVYTKKDPFPKQPSQQQLQMHPMPTDVPLSSPRSKIEILLRKQLISASESKHGGWVQQFIDWYVGSCKHGITSSL